MKNPRFASVILIILGLAVGYYAYQDTHKPYKLGLDLNGGTHLVYQADISKVDPTSIEASMQALRDTIENRINVFGVAEPLIQTERATVNGQRVEKLVVELPGVTDIDKAVALIGQTPVLDFRAATTTATSTRATLTASSTIFATSSLYASTSYIPTELTGRFLERATVDFDPTTRQPMISLQFNAEGKELFAKITEENVGNAVGIFLDNQPISEPVVNEAIRDGRAVISGNFTPQEAQQLVRNLNYGALPVPISLIGSQTIGASLGTDALNKSMEAGIIGFAIVALFLILWYRLPGLIATAALLLYVAMNLAIFKLIPVTLTSTGLAAFILSIGMAVDANILIFERMKEEIEKGLPLHDAIHEGFNRAWTSIRDGNLSSIITAVILFAFATTALIKGFALVFLIGVLVSLFTAITASRTLLLAIAPKYKEAGEKPLIKFLFGHGMRFKK
jgi:preprotein translocase subunit SecD